VRRRDPLLKMVIFAVCLRLKESLGVTEKVKIRPCERADFGFIMRFSGVLPKKQGLSIRTVLSLAEV
jgi:hypothetical protein